MLELRTLGSVDLRGPGGPVGGLLGRSKRLGLLVYLAASRPPGPRRRARLLELFWPDSPPDRSRAALRQSLQLLANELGPDALEGRGTDAIALREQALWCDVPALERAAAAGRDTEVLALFRGDFLDGFHLAGCPEFDAWCSETRLRTRQLAARAARTLARDAGRVGDWEQGSAWALRWLELEPDDEDALRASLDFLSRQDRRAQALELYAAFEARLRRQLGVSPSDETRARVASLRTPGAPERGGAPAPVDVAPPPASVGVLPLLNLTGDRELDWFCDGITEELIAELALLPGIAVAARTSSFAFRGRTVDVREIGRRLGVATLVEGSVRHAGPSLRFTVQLVETRSGFHLWADGFEQSMQDALRTPGELARRIALALRRRLLSPARLPSRDTEDREAFLLFLRGQHHMFRRSPRDLARSVELFSGACERDPRYAAARGGLALALASLPVYCGTPTALACPRALEEADRALARDPALSSAHLARCLAQSMFLWDWPGAEVSVRASIAAAPADPFPRSIHGFYVLSHDGRFERAIAEASAAREADPLSLPAISYLGYVAYLARDWRRAEAAAREALELDPGFPLALWVLEMTLEARGETEEALEVARRLVAGSEASPLFRAHLARSLALAGDATARTELARVVAALGPDSPVWYWVAGVHAALGELDAGLEALRRAEDTRSNFLVFAAVHPTLDAFRADPRFQELLHRMGLPVTLR